VQFLQGTGDLVTLRAEPNFKQLGRRFGPGTQEAARRIRELKAEQLRAWAAGDPVAVEVAGSVHQLEPGDLDVVEQAAGELVVERDEGCTIALDPFITEALRLEGLARELVNRIQRLRKESGLEVSDRIRLGVFGAHDVQRAVEEHGAYIAAETLAIDVVSGAEPGDGPADAHYVNVDGVEARIAVRRA
jgi:isoleucyl-tRNA synthetase